MNVKIQGKFRNNSIILGYQVNPFAGIPRVVCSFVTKETDLLPTDTHKKVLNSQSEKRNHADKIQILEKMILYAWRKLDTLSECYRLEYKYVQ